jgi:hypothetical protein
MTESSDQTSPRVPPNGSAWKVAQRNVSEANDAARRVGKQQRAAEEKKAAARRRAADEKGDVYR